MRLLILIFVD
ncbi:hypothetical protein PENSTE_c013G04278 [Penicillium steckii]|uniref:Uncharacterized protein n=1 Tax=Penicillium steckii TaxID=303698 RepID=A0A1V6T389_9EURO|nr:hypothetical protein PENSTE_c013G04278 [Penicillium steckii]